MTKNLLSSTVLQVYIHVNDNNNIIPIIQN